MASIPDFSFITELAGDPGSREQIQRAYRRYYWAGEYAKGADVLEVACGVGQGLGYLARFAKSVRGGDISESVLEHARRHYGNRVELRRFDAENLPYADGSFDVVLMFEAIYYLKDAPRFVREAKRVLRAGGYLLLATANKDLFDFTPSAYSVRYYGVMELAAMLEEAGFGVRFFGDSPLTAVSSWQRTLRPLKRMATATGLMPKGKRMKALLKRIVFGPIEKLPAEIEPGFDASPAPIPLAGRAADTQHKVILCEARRTV